MRMRFALILIAVIVVTGCATAQKTRHSASLEIVYPDANESYPYEVKIEDFYGAEGFTFIYYLSDSWITVVFRDDYGSSPKELYSRALDVHEGNELRSFLRSFPLASLRTKYEDETVDDGLQMSFEFRLEGLPHRTIVLRNVQPHDLETLCERLNDLIPDELHARQSRGAVYVGQNP